MEVTPEQMSVETLRYCLSNGILTLPPLDKKYINAILEAFNGETRYLLNCLGEFLPYLDKLSGMENQHDIAVKWQQTQIKHLYQVGKILEYFYVTLQAKKEMEKNYGKEKAIESKLLLPQQHSKKRGKNKKNRQTNNRKSKR